jgi:hypothetical protein
MKRVLIKIFSLYISLTLSFGVNSDTDCQELLNWIYKDLTIQNLDTSYDRLVNKMLLGLLHVHKRSRISATFNDDYSQLKNTIGSLDESLGELIDDKISRFINFVRNNKVGKIDKEDLASVVNAWNSLKGNSRILFKNLSQEYQIDQWDIMTSQVLSESIEFGTHKEKYESELKRLSLNFNTARVNLLKGRELSFKNLKENVDKSKDKLMKHFRKNFISGMSEFSTLCREEEVKHLVIEENYVCLRDESPSHTDFLDRLGLILTAKDTKGNEYFSFTDEPRLKNLSSEPTINIHEVAYKTNILNENTTYCKRNPELVDTIVLHHTAFRKGPQSVNDFHLKRGTSEEPWLMVGYNYLVEDDFPSWRDGFKESDPPKAYTARPLDIQGAHAGERTEPLTEDQKVFYKDKTISCGNNFKGFKELNVLETLDDAGTLSGNLTTFGIAVLGDFSVSKLEKVAGVIVPRVVSGNEKDDIISIKDEIKFDQMIKNIAKLSCDIKKKYPNVKRIVPHQYFKDGNEQREHTKCPGYLIDHLDRIALEAKKLGCIFEVERERKR